MKRILLSLFCAMSLTAIANADDAVVTFINDEKYEGEIKNITTFPEMENANDYDFTIKDVCSFKITGENISVIKASNNPHLQWAKSTTLTVTPAENITLTKIEMVGTTASYTGTLVSETGECSIDGLINTWTGSTSTPIEFTYTPKKTNPMRILYMTIQYTIGGSSAIDTVSVDVNAPVKYYNLEGVEVVNPSNGLYIRQEGNNASKVIF